MDKETTSSLAEWKDHEKLISMAENEIHINDHVKGILLCVEKIREKHPKSDKFVSDTIPCPLCEIGTLSFDVSDHVNGHIMMSCSNCIKYAHCACN